jgi:hypothetical protein
MRQLNFFDCHTFSDQIFSVIIIATIKSFQSPFMRRSNRFGHQIELGNKN